MRPVEREDRRRLGLGGSESYGIVIPSDTMKESDFGKNGIHCIVTDRVYI
jgi:hypothetical protein